MRLHIYGALFFLIQLAGVSQTIVSQSSGNWSSSSTWVGGVVPTATDDVEITGNHVVTLDLSPTGSEIVDICNALSVGINASLQLGYDGSEQNKQFKISGNLHCDGTISAGRNVPADDNSGEGLIFGNNSTLVVQLSSDNSTITGKGYLHPKSLIIQNQGSPRKVTIDHYNIIMDSDFIVKGLADVEVEIAKYTFMNAGSTVAIAGRAYSSSPTNFSASMLVKGIIYTNNLSLFTKNESNSSSITLDNEGVITANNINGGVNPANSGAGGFQLTLNERSIFRCGASGVSSPATLAAADPNFTVVNNGEIKLHYSQTLTSPSQVVSQVNAFDKNNRDQLLPIKGKIGATHIAGWYNFTDKNYLEEGSDRFKDWGSTNIKTTISADNGKMESAYPFNSDWPQYSEMKGVINDERVHKLFSDPYFTTHAFWAPSKGVNGFYKNGADRNHARYLAVEQQNYNAAKEILIKYGNLGKTFLFQNWEGDWMLRGANKQWEDNRASIPDDVKWQIEGMARMWRAHMRGIEKAVAEHPEATSKIQYAVEYNKLFDNVNGTRKTLMELDVPCLVADVLPKVRMHMSSWSAYDGNWDETARPFPTGFWHGMEIAGFYTNNTKGLEGIPVQIGEIGYNENAPFQSLSNQQILDRYDKLMGVVAKLGVQNVYLWNLYGSGAQSVSLEKDVQYEASYLFQVLDGKWVIDPDNKFGLAGGHLKDNYFNSNNLNPTVSQPIDDITLTTSNTEEISLSQVFADGDGDNLTFTASSANEPVVTTSITNSTLSLNGQAAGTTVVTVKASDPYQGSVSTSFRVIVLEGRAASVSIGSANYASVSLALDAAQTGDVLEIRGIHTESIAITKAITLRGLDPRLDKIQSAQSLAAAQSRVISISRPSGSDETLNVTIENLGIRFGKDKENGGGINADKLNGLLTLKKLIIEHNSTDKNGGGLGIAGSNANVQDCIIRNNTATLDGGGLIIASNNSVSIDSDINILSSLIDSNEGRNGGGLYINGNKDFGDTKKINVYLENTSISRNTTTSNADGAGGGAIWSKSALWKGDNTSGNVSLQMIHTTLFDNLHASTAKNGIQFTSASAGANTNFSMYNAIAVSKDDLAQASINFANTNTTAFINNVTGAVTNESATVSQSSNNNSTGNTASAIGLNNKLSANGADIPVWKLSASSQARDYCTAAAGVALPQTDARGMNRDATPDAGAYEFVESLTVSETLFISTDLTYEQVTITASGKLIIQPTATLTVNSSLNNSGEVIVESGGSLALLGSATGNATIKRKTTGGAGYSIIGAPVSGFNLSALNANYLYTYNEGQNTWTTPTGDMTSGQGYFVGYDAAAPEISFTGTMNTGNQAVNVTKNGDGFNLVANPYAAAISISDFLSNSTNSSTTTGAVYFWDDGGVNAGSDRGGDYITVNNLGVTVSSINLSDGVSGLQGVTAASTGYIGSVQGFFVEAMAAGQVAFTSDMQATTSYANTDTGFYRQDRLVGQLVKLSLATSNHRDELIIGFTEQGTAADDYGLDARKYQGEEPLAFYSVMNDSRMAIQGLPIFHATDDDQLVSLGTDLPQAGEYEIEVMKLSGFSDGQSVLLRDKVSEKTYDLFTTQNITFQADAETTGSDRFELLVTNRKDILAVAKPRQLGFYGDESGLTIFYQEAILEQISIYDLSGKVIFDESVSFENFEVKISPTIQKGVIYILRVGNKAAKFILR
ncbi:MAG: choice-of-anchor Q domain-containing protein [Cyclobacteriaceae bacterium]